MVTVVEALKVKKAQGAKVAGRVEEAMAVSNVERCMEGRTLVIVAKSSAKRAALPQGIGRASILPHQQPLL
jgi:hypothetical protein